MKLEKEHLHEMIDVLYYNKEFNIFKGFKTKIKEGNFIIGGEFIFETEKISNYENISLNLEISKYWSTFVENNRSNEDYKICLIAGTKERLSELVIYYLTNFNIINNNGQILYQTIFGEMDQYKLLDFVNLVINNLPLTDKMEINEYSYMLYEKEIEYHEQQINIVKDNMERMRKK